MASIRSKLILAFSAVLVLVGGLTVYGIYSVSGFSDLVRKIYDEPLMGVSHARAAYAKFHTARAAMDLALDFTDTAAEEAAQKITALVKDIDNDLSVVGERISGRVVSAHLTKTRRLISQWQETGMKLLRPPKEGLTQIPMPDRVSDLAMQSGQAIERLVHYVAAEGYQLRSAAMADMATTRSRMVTIAGLIAVVAIGMSLTFAVSLSQPIAVSTAVAERVAAGDFSDIIHSKRKDELGRLLRALADMQANLRAAAEAEKEEARLHHARFLTAINNIPSGICMYDGDQRLVVANDSFAKMYGLPPDVLKPGIALRDILQHRIASGVYAGESPEAYIQERLNWVARGKPGSKTQQLSDGRTIQISHQPMEGGGWVTSHTDVTALQEAQEKIAYLALHDALTGLPNRVLFRESVEQTLPQARRGASIAVMCLDLDRFKNVNDTLGHPVGDELLKAVAERIAQCVRETDTVARLGGDEFAILQLSDKQPHDATALASRLCETLAKPFELENHQVAVGASVGIALVPNDGDDPDRLMKNADLALYRAKSDGRGVYHFFAPEMDARMQLRRLLELDLRRSLEIGEFELHYQPLLELSSGELSGFEALLRWNHPVRGMVSPADFIPIAEETGLIVPLGAWVIQQACRDAAEWPYPVRVAVNLSSVQFRNDELVTTVFKALAESGLAAGRLELEITESVLLKDNSRTLEILHQLRDMGVRIAMDDFGTGYSSLSYLRSFPFDKVKIDRSFIKDLSNGQNTSAIVDAVANLSRSLGIATTAEGVETEAQLRSVKAAGYNEMQGFLLSPARPASEIMETFFSKTAKGIDTLTAAVSRKPP